MSFRELRNFAEGLRLLGYPRHVSIESFKQPNFALLADILKYLVNAFDDSANVITDTDSESDRVLFIKSVVQVMAVKAGLKLSAKKLYSADGLAVKEALKLVVLLTSAAKATVNSSNSTEFSTADLGAKLAELKTARALTSEITSRGAKLYDSLATEVDLREERNAAAAKPLEISEIESKVSKSIRQIQENLRTSLSNMSNLASDEQSLAEKIEKKKQDIERVQKRLAILLKARPQFMDEYEKLEVELDKLYNVYIGKFRNLSFLEHHLEEYNRVEQDRLEETENALRRMQQRLREEEMRAMHGDQATEMLMSEPQDEEEDEQAAQKAMIAAKRNAAKGKTNIVGSMKPVDDSGDDDSDGSNLIDDDDEDDDEDDDDDDDDDQAKGQADEEEFSDNDF